jgi:hypothetical protein
MKVFQQAKVPSLLTAHTKSAYELTRNRNSKKKIAISSAILPSGRRVSFLCNLLRGGGARRRPWVATCPASIGSWSGISGARRPYRKMGERVPASQVLLKTGDALIGMHLSKCALNTSRLNSWIALSVALAAGCGAQKWTSQADARADGRPQATGNEIVQFSLSEGQYISITISTPGIALGVIVIRDSKGNILHTQKETTSSVGANPVTGANSIGLLWDGCDDDGRPQPTGIYTAEFAATDGDPHKTWRATARARTCGVVQQKSPLARFASILQAGSFQM